MIPAQIVGVAQSWIGTPYLHQASVRGAGADCLGLIRGVWREAICAEPESIPAYSQDWSEPSGHEDLWAAARRWLNEKDPADEAPGDVLLFRMRSGAVAKHLGIAARIGAAASFIHAYTGHGVVETALSDPWRRKIAARFEFPAGA
ncbi:MAG: peptidase [Cypionkella sp.]|uniref:peptidase n=1 Tax=Cypionkella sp. TaxID=2811411 RepID=UPI002AB9BCC2|nr:peptidase [Cypionkella sp.]MDZ4312528.1 peptidase [Cypionkella sp.]MDZ4393022.1 peptidase [Cypionkella sp.]